MSESDTVFNEQDWRCIAVQIMLSTDPSYDNRTIASTLKMQIWMVQHLVNLEVVERMPKAEDTTRKDTTKEFIEKVQTIIDETPQWHGDPLVQSGGQRQTLGVAAGLSAGPQVPRDPGLASEGVLRLCTLLSLTPSFPDLNPLDYFVWSYVENITNMTSHNTKASLIAMYLPSSHRHLWKKHAPSSGSISRRWLRLKVAILIRCQLYYIIKLPELIFSIKVLK